MARILVDTSIWIDHFLTKDAQLIDLLNQNRVLMHPMILVELTCGCLHNRFQLLALLRNLSGIVVASHDEALFCLERNKLMTKGIGFMDLHLLAATLLNAETLLSTRDKCLQKLACSLNIGFIGPAA